MPISVVCPGCKARFSVSEKFAGKKGPCPKCKAIILVPEPIADEVKIHVPEQFASGGKDSKGRAILKPILREETKVKPVVVAAIATTAVVALGGALALRGVSDKTPFIAAGLVILSPALAVAAYTFLRDDELEPYRGRALVVRAALCGFAYALLWAAYIPLPMYGIVTGEPWQWLFVAPAFVAVGAAAAWATLDLDFGSAALHHAFYLVVTIVLRAAVGLPPLWAVATATT
jgi:hypothetical protein